MERLLVLGIIIFDQNKKLPSHEGSFYVPFIIRVGFTGGRAMRVPTIFYSLLTTYLRTAKGSPYSKFMLMAS